MIGVIPEIYCTNCVHAYIYRKALCSDKMLKCRLLPVSQQEDINLTQQDPPPACNDVKLISLKF